MHAWLMYSLLSSTCGFMHALVWANIKYTGVYKDKRTRTQTHLHTLSYTWTPMYFDAAESLPGSGTTCVRECEF